MSRVPPNGRRSSHWADGLREKQVRIVPSRAAPPSGDNPTPIPPATAIRETWRALDRVPQGTGSAEGKEASATCERGSSPIADASPAQQRSTITRHSGNDCRNTPPIRLGAHARIQNDDHAVIALRADQPPESLRSLITASGTWYSMNGFPPAARIASNRAWIRGWSGTLNGSLVMITFCSAHPAHPRPARNCRSRTAPNADCP